MTTQFNAFRERLKAAQSGNPIDPLVQTPEEIAQHYKAALDSVKLIKSEKPKNLTDAEWAKTVETNKAHLRIMLAKTFWTTEDLSPLQDAVV